MLPLLLALKEYSFFYISFSVVSPSFFALLVERVLRMVFCRSMRAFTWLMSVLFFLDKLCRTEEKGSPKPDFPLHYNIYHSNQYSCHGLIWISFSSISQKALTKALAKRALVINGMLWSMAPRRIL